MVINLLLIMIAVSLVSAGFVWMMIYGPIKKLIAGTKRIAMGDMDHVIETKSSDELGLLASSFNKMTRDLKKANSEITDWTRALEDRVEYKTQELQKADKLILQAEKLASVGKIAAIVAHELNNPLSGIVAYAKLLIKRIDNNRFSEEGYEKSREILEMVMNEALRCGEIVKNLLQFSRQSDLVVGPNDIRNIIHESLRLIEHLINLRSIDLRLQIEDNIPHIHCDPQKIKQVLLALLINACDAIADEGMIGVACKFLSDRKSAEIIIQDNGLGMDEETERRIFEPFFTTKEEGDGVGLGLAVVLSIVERHGGSITVKSTQNQGTIFTILLPQFPPQTMGMQQEREVAGKDII